MKMRAWIYIFLTTVFIGVFKAPLAHAENFGLGIILGDPTGLSAKAKLDERHAIDGALAYSSGRHSGLQLHMDYLWDRARSWGTTQGPLNMYYGLGGRLITYNDREDNSQISLGPRGSLGLDFNINNPNLEFFGELAMILELIPSIAADLDAGIGVRIRF
ncbi:MAG TPA: hypothetical protein VIG33_01760 [Pseudobdellovibrionaceae bacterium]|jgi:hypothetical protein